MNDLNNLNGRDGADALSALASGPLFRHAPELLERASALAVAMPAAVVAVPRLLCNVCDVFNARFTLGDDVVPASWVMGPAGMLPCAAAAAEDAAHRLFGISLGVSLRRDAQALFGLRVGVAPVTGNLADIVRALFFIRSTQDLYGLRRDAVLDVTEVIEIYKAHFDSILSRADTEGTGDLSWPPPSRQH